MNGQPGVRVFLIQYFPVFMGAIFASVFALVFAIPLFFDSYFQALSLAEIGRAHV